MTQEQLNTGIIKERLISDIRYNEKEFLNAFNMAAEYHRRNELTGGWKEHYNTWYKEMRSREKKLGDLYKDLNLLA